MLKLHLIMQWSKLSNNQTSCQLRRTGRRLHWKAPLAPVGTSRSWGSGPSSWTPCSLAADKGHPK